jgi:acetyl-CoA acetyltransferase family protein
VDLLAMTLDEVTRRAGCPKEAVDDVVAGCVTPAGDQASDVGRLATLKAGFPIDVPGVQINRFCGSGQQAIHFAAQAIRSGDMDIAIGCGVERMSRVPMFSDGRFSPEFIADFPYGIVHQGISAEMLVDKWGLSREALDEYALQSHCRAAAAARAGWSQREMTSVEEIRTDQGVRANPDPARLAALPGVFRPNGAITAGNSSQISDGAAAVLLASGQKAGSVA